MAVRLDQVVVIIDDFSYRSLGSDNVYYYDVGCMDSVRLYDYVYNGYGEVDDFEYLYLDELGGFYPINPADFTEPEQSYYTLEMIEEGTLYDTGLDPSGNTIYYSDYLEFTGDEPTSDETELHGDWILDSFLNQLDNQDTDIILIDVDQWSGDVLDIHLQELFLLVDTPYADGQVTQLQLIVDSWLAEHNSEEEAYLFSALSYSIAGVLPDFNQSVALDWMESQYTIVVQASPNVGQGAYNWGGLYPNVINVGAWNVDEDGNSLHADPSTDETLDIFADGYVVHEEWGSTFGTSFATPRVAAELSNELDIILEDVNQQLLSGELTTEEMLATESLPYADIVDIMLSTVSSPILVDFNNGWVYDPISVLSDDITSNLFPVTVPQSVGGNGIPYTTVETVYLVTDLIDHGDGSQTRTYLDQDGVEWSVYYTMNADSYSELLTNAGGDTIEKQALWNGDGSHTATKSSSYRDRIGNPIDKVWQWDSATSTETINRIDANTGQISVSQYRYDDFGDRTTIYADTVLNEDTVFSYDISTSLFCQQNNGGYTYSTQQKDGGTMPQWILMDSATGLLSGTPSNDDVNLLELTVTATDAEGISISDDLYIVINNTNDAPTLSGDFIGGVTVTDIGGIHSVGGVLAGSDVDDYPHYGTATHWTTVVETVDEQGGVVRSYGNSLGDTMVTTIEGDLDGAFTESTNIILANGDWHSKQVVTDESGNKTITRTNSLGENQSDIITYSGDGSYQASLSGSREYYGALYTDATGIITYDASGVATSITGQSIAPSGEVAITSMDVDESGAPVLVITTATDYGIHSVHREGLLYTVATPQGTYGSITLDNSANWSYTLDKDDLDTAALTGDQVVTDTFTIMVSDGIDEIIDNIEISVDPTAVDAMVKTDDIHYLTQTGISYLSGGNEINSPFLVSEGELRIKDGLPVDSVIMPEGVYDFDINITDAIDVLRHIVNLELLTEGGVNYHAADVNNDDNINITDAITILRHIVNLESIDSLDLIDEQGTRIQQLDVNSNGDPQILLIVANGDVNLSGEFADSYIVPVDLV